MYPLIDTPYEKQIEEKLEAFKVVLRNWKKVAIGLTGSNKFVQPPWLQDGEFPCEFKGAVECDE